MRQIIFVLVSILVFVCSSGALAAMFNYYGNFLSRNILTRRLGDVPLNSEYRSFGFGALSKVVTENKEDAVLGYKSGATSKVNQKLIGNRQGEMPSVPLYASTALDLRVVKTDSWFPGIDISTFVKMENERAAHFRALLSSRHDRYSDDS